jgi:hypothetical protein
MAHRSEACRDVAAILAAVTIAAAGGAGQVPGGEPAASGASHGVDGPCQLTQPQQVTRSYTVLGRARVLVVWTGRHEIGDARLGWIDASDGRRLELLIGTDPARAPRKMNRWGYVTETVCGRRGHVLGLMTPSDEETIEEANGNLAAGAYALKVIRASHDGSAVRTERFRVASDPKATYRDLDARLAALPPPGAARPSTRPAAADAGFLFSIDALLHEAVKAPRAPGRAPPQRTYIYGGRVYQLAMRQARDVPTFTSGGVTYRDLIEGTFEVRNTTTGDETPFELTFGSTGALAAVPVRIVYRPRWWLEVELHLRGGPTS